MKDAYSNAIIQIKEDSVDYVLNKKTSIQNNCIELLGGVKSKAISRFATDADVDKYYKKNISKNSVDINSKLFSGSFAKRKNLNYEIEYKAYLTNNERYLLFFLLAAHNQNYKENVPVEIIYNIAKSIFGRGSNLADVNYTEILRVAARGLLNKQLRYFHGRDLVEYPILRKATNVSIENNRAISLALNPDLSDFFVSYDKGNYTNIILLNVLNLSQKSQALYLTLKKDYGVQRSRSKKKDIALYYSKREVLDLFNSKSKNFPKFQVDILNKAIEDINANSNDISIHFHRCLKDECDKCSTSSKRAELCFRLETKIPIPEISNLEGLFCAKNEILNKEIHLKNKKYVIQDFKRHSVFEDTIIVNLIDFFPEGDNKVQYFSYEIDVDEIYQMYKNIIDTSVENKINELSFQSPGEVYMYGLKNCIQIDISGE